MAATIDQDVELGAQKQPVSTVGERSPRWSGDWWLCLAAFTICGTVHLWYWNAILNLTAVVNAEYFSTMGEMANVMTILFQGGCVIGFLVSNYVGELKAKLNMSSAAVYVAACVLTPMILLLSSEKARIALWCISGFVFGLCSGVQQVHHFAVAAVQPSGAKTAYASTGQGLAGLLSYGLCMVLTQASHLAPKTCIAINMSIAAVLCIVGCGCIHYLVKRPACVRKIHAHLDEMERAKNAGGDKPPKLLSFIVYEPLFVTFFVFTVSYSVFPSIGPVHWGTKYDNQTDIVMGLSQIGILIGRFIPNFAWSIIPLRLTTYLSLGRLLFILAFILSAVYVNNVTSSYPWQMILLFCLSFTEGWLGTLGLIYSAIARSNTYQAARLASLSVGLLMIGVAVGLALCPLFRIMAKL